MFIFNYLLHDCAKKFIRLPSPSFDLRLANKSANQVKMLNFDKNFLQRDHKKI